LLDQFEVVHQKRPFEEPVRCLVILLAFIIGGLMIGQAMMAAILLMADIDVQNLGPEQTLSLSQRNSLRFGLLISHAMLFIAPSIAFVQFYRKESSFHFFETGKLFSTGKLLLWGVIILVSYPLIARLAIWNSALPLAEWMTSSQDNSTWLLEQTLKMESISEFFLSILLVGVSAAVGEELLFRGIIQRYLSANMSSPHIGIIVASLLFGLFHMQLSRFLPLAFLGLLLGYSYYYTKSIWVPILLHLANNGLQVIGAYVSMQNGELTDIDSLPDQPIYYAIISALLTISLFYFATNQSVREVESRP